MLILQKYFHEPGHNRGFCAFFLLMVFIITAEAANCQQDIIQRSLSVDSLAPVNLNAAGSDSVVPPDRTGITEKVYYFGKDSTVFNLDDQSVRLYGPDSYVKYGSIEVKASRIVFSFADYTAHAAGIPDSTGTLQGRPVFTDGDNQFDEDSLAYNFKTKKGISYGAHTREGEAHLISMVSKKQENDWVHLRNGMFTTCDRPKPHYHFRLSKAIVVPNDKVVSGPLYMKVGRIPTPLALPFGFFPNKRESTHGILLPGYGNGQSKGFFVQNLGYYVPVSPYLDTRLLFDVYTRGSWSVRNITNYKKRYRYNGNFNVSRTLNETGFKELPSYFRQVTFNVQWSHQQDAKARPNSRFNANVNLGSSQNFRNNLNSSQQNFLTSTFNSGLQWNKSFPGKPFSLAATANHTQNTQTRQVQVTLPSLTLNISRINLLKRVFPQSPVGVNGAVNFDNFISAQESEFRPDRSRELFRSMQNGMRFNSTASTSWKLGPYLTLNPNATASGFLSFRKVGPVFNQDLGRDVLDTVPGLRFASVWNAGISANTRIYGTWAFRKSGWIKAVRHLIQPSFGMSYTPYQNFTRYGFYSETGDFLGYSPFDAARFRPGNTREAASVNVGVNQNIEAKFRDRSSAKVLYKKVKLIDGWRMSASNNLLADSLNWSNLSMSAFTTIAQNVTLNYSSTHSFYDRDSLGREIDTGLLNAKGRLTRIEGANLALNFRFTGGKGKKKQEDVVQPAPDITPAEQDMITNNRASYVDFSVPWSFNTSYNLRMTRTWDVATQRDKDKLNQTMIFNGDITIFEQVAISVNSGYNFDDKKITTTTVGLHINLHCWEFSASYVPFGIRQSYMVQLNIRSAMFKDLKLQRRGNLGGEDNLLY